MHRPDDDCVEAMEILRWARASPATGDRQSRPRFADPQPHVPQCRRRYFQDLTSAGGFGHLQKGHGVSFADLDNDGDQDIHLVVGGAYETDRIRNALFENPGNGNHWIALKLEGVRSNRPGIGARLRVVVREDGAERVIHRTVRSGGSFGVSPLRQEIGVGRAERIVKVEIRWPSGGPVQILEGLPMDRHYRVREGDPRVTPIPLGRLKLGGA